MPRTNEYLFRPVIFLKKNFYSFQVRILHFYRVGQMDITDSTYEKCWIIFYKILKAINYQRWCFKKELFIFAIKLWRQGYIIGGQNYWYLGRVHERLDSWPESFIFFKYHIYLYKKKISYLKEQLWWSYDRINLTFVVWFTGPIMVLLDFTFRT